MQKIEHKELQARARIIGSIAERVTNNEKDFKRVQVMLEQNNKIDGEQRYIEHLNEVVTAGRTTLSMYADTSETGARTKKKILSFLNSAPKIYGNLEKVFKCCKNSETDLFINGKRSQIKQ